jgi:DNA-binding NtrC family response regulator
MLNVLLVCDNPSTLAVLAGKLSIRHQVSVSWADSQQTALNKITKDSPQVLVTGEHLRGGSALSLIKDVVKVDPFINCAMVSALPEQDFHEMTEGLGVFMQLPSHPGEEEAEKMLQLLESIGALRLKEEED